MSSCGGGSSLAAAGTTIGSASDGADSNGATASAAPTGSSGSSTRGTANGGGRAASGAANLDGSDVFGVDTISVSGGDITKPRATLKGTIAIENGKRVDSVRRRVARRAVPAAGYVRAVVTRDDGSRAWVQPVRR